MTKTVPLRISALLKSMTSGKSGLKCWESIIISARNAVDIPRYLMSSVMIPGMTTGPKTKPTPKSAESEFAVAVFLKIVEKNKESAAKNAVPKRISAHERNISLGDIPPSISMIDVIGSSIRMISRLKSADVKNFPMMIIVDVS